MASAVPTSWSEPTAFDALRGVADALDTSAVEPSLLLSAKAGVNL
jgi:hypothetical protein